MHNTAELANWATKSKTRQQGARTYVISVLRCKLAGGLVWGEVGGVEVVHHAARTTHFGHRPLTP